MSDNHTPELETTVFSSTEAEPAPAVVLAQEPESNHESVREPATEQHPFTEPGAEPVPLTEPEPEREIPSQPEPEPGSEPSPEPEPEPEPLPSEEAGTVSALDAPDAPVPVLPVESVPVESVPVESAPAAAEPAKLAEPEEPEESFADIFSEFQRSSSRRDPGSSSQIRGTVVSVTAESVYVDIGFKSEGILPLTAFAAYKEPVKPGDTLQVSPKGRDEDGYYQLSLFKTAQPKDWSSLEKAFNEKATIVGTVSAVVKGGLHVDVGVRAFLPASRSGARDAAEMEKLIGQEVRVRVTKLDVQDEDVVVDRRVVLEEEALETKSRRYAEVAEGAVIDGTVRSLTDYGAFVDLGGIDGLLHISDISWSRIANAADVLSVGQQLEVKVLRIDPEGKRISLGLKQLQPHPWDAVAAQYALGDKIRGTVSRIADFGAFIEIAPGVEGLVHLSEMSYVKRILKATEVVKVGDVVEAVILSLNVADKRIGLGLKQALGDPWVDAAKRLNPGSIVEGPVSSITKFGAFVTASEGVEGLVHISEIVADRRLNHPSDVLRVGQVVKALVLDLDKEKRQLRLSMKQLIPTSLDEFLAEHKAGDLVTGRVASLTGGVAQVELGEGIFCACKLPVAPPKPVETGAPAAAANKADAKVDGKIDLSAFSSMLKTKWKTGTASTGAAAALSGRIGTGIGAVQESGPETGVGIGVELGQVRRFRILTLDAGSKQLSLELIS